MAKVQPQGLQIQWWLGLFASMWFYGMLWCSAVYAKDFAAVEGQLRAAVTVGVLRFTSWQNPIVVELPNVQLCLVGNPVSGPFLLPVDGETQIGPKKLSVRRIKGKNWSGCQVVVIGENFVKSEMHSLFDYAQRQNVLTVCDGCTDFVASQTMIQLKLEKQRVKFDVNLKHASAAAVRLDASLLELASLVRQ